MKRRDFHKMALTVGAWGAANINVLGANDRIRVAVLGCGVRGTDHIEDIVRSNYPGVEIHTVCDVWEPALKRAVRNAMGNGRTAPKTTMHYAEVLDDADVDAVVIATPDFGHAKILKEAVEAGKDAYCEKPMAVVLKEGLDAVKAVRKQKRVVQVGTQYRSDPQHVGCAEVIHSGVLGKICRVSISQNFMEPRWRKDTGDVQEADIDWNQFQLHHKKRPFDPKRFRRWYLYRDYTNGLPGLWMSHYYNLVAWYMRDLYPEDCVALRNVFLWGDDGRETCDTLGAILHYPSGFQLDFTMSLCNSADTHCIFYGTNGKLDFWNHTISGDGGDGPSRIAEERVIPPAKVPSSHMGNFLQCIRTREDPVTPVEMGLAHSVAGIMTAESANTGSCMRFNAETLKMTRA